MLPVAHGRCTVLMFTTSALSYTLWHSATQGCTLSLNPGAAFQRYMHPHFPQLNCNQVHLESSGCTLQLFCSTLWLHCSTVQKALTVIACLFAGRITRALANGGPASGGHQPHRRCSPRGRLQQRRLGEHTYRPVACGSNMAALQSTH